MKFEKTIASAIAAGALLANTALPIFAATTITISRNGSDSNNTGNVSLNTTTTVTQNNVANFSNDVDADADTGDNDVKDNTGGEVDVDTGNATVGVSVNNTANFNTAEVEGCCAQDAEVLIQGNGSDSDNDADLDLDNHTSVFQNNVADFYNDVDVDADTGDNDVEDNTGGDVDVDTGKASVGVWLENTANGNSAVIGGGDADGGMLSARILGNGSDSDNEIDLDFNRTQTLQQTNFADFDNDVDVEAETGDNDVEDNTGGETSLNTGAATVLVEVDNMANFNWADLDCGCLMDVEAKVSGNGSDSDNDIIANLDDHRTVLQFNDAWFDNDLDEIEAETGDNDVEDNTGEVDEDSDPSLDTGEAGVSIGVENSANSNGYGDDGGDMDWDFPSMGFSLNLSFDLSDLLEALGY